MVRVKLYIYRLVTFTLFPPSLFCCCHLRNKIDTAYIRIVPIFHSGQQFRLIRLLSFSEVKIGYVRLDTAKKIT